MLRATTRLPTIQNWSPGTSSTITAQAEQHDLFGLGCVPLGGAADSAAAGDRQGRTAGISGLTPQLQRERGLSSHPARQVSGRLPVGTEGAPEAGPGGPEGDALQFRNHRLLYHAHCRHWQNGDRRHGCQAVWQAHTVSGPHSGTGRLGHQGLPGAVAPGHGGPLCGEYEVGQRLCGLRQHPERGSESGAVQAG